MLCFICCLKLISQTYREKQVLCSNARVFSFTFHSVQVSRRAECQKNVPSQALSPKKSTFFPSIQLLMPQRLPSGKLSQAARTCDLCKWKSLSSVTGALYSSVQCCHGAWILVPKDQHVLDKLRTGGVGVSWVSVHASVSREKLGFRNCDLRYRFCNSYRHFCSRALFSCSGTQYSEGLLG